MSVLTGRAARIALAVLLVGVLGVELFRYIRAFEDLSEGRGILLATADLLESRGLDLTDQEVQVAKAKLDRAAGKLDSASGVIQSDPVLSAASYLPWLGDQVSAAGDLSEIARRSTTIGSEALAAARDYQRIRETQGGALSEKVVPVLQAVEPHAAIIQQELAAIRERRAQMVSGLLPPLSSARSQLDKRLAEIETRLSDYDRARRMAPKILGYDGAQTYLVLAHDNTEILASGGFILVYGFITFDSGKLQRLQFDSVANLVPGEDWPAPGAAYIEPPKPLRTHLLVRGWPMGLAEASWWPDFPTVAQRAIEIYRASGGREEHIDGVIGVNFLTLEKLLEVTGPVTVERYGETVSAENVIEKTLRITHPDALRPWETDRYDFAGYLAKGVIDRTLGAGPGKWTSLLSALHTLGREKNLLLYHTDPGVQQVIAEAGWDGAIRQDAGDYLMVVDSNLRRNKLNLLVESSIDLTVRLDSQGGATDAVAISYSNGYSAWAQGRDRALAALVIGGGALDLYGNYLRVLAPQGSSLEGMTLGAVTTDPEDVSVEDSKTVFGCYFTVPRDATRPVEVTYLSPSVAVSDGDGHEYRLLVQKQPGTRAIPLTITVEVPPGMEIRASALDGKPLESATGRIVTDLRQDRELVVRYR